MSYSNVIDGVPRKRKHQWRAVTVYGDDALQCEDCRIARRVGTGEVWHDGGWIKATVPRCGESVKP
jgi:hypothetical protein